MNNAASRRNCSLTKHLSSRCGLPLWVICLGYLASKIIQAIVIDLWHGQMANFCCYRQHRFWPRTQKKHLNLIMKLPAKMLQFYSDGSCYAVERDNTSMVLPKDGLCMQLHGPGRQDVLTSTIVAKLIVGVTKQSFDWIWSSMYEHA